MGVREADGLAVEHMLTVGELDFEVVAVRVAEKVGVVDAVLVWDLLGEGVPLTDPVRVLVGDPLGVGDPDGATDADGVGKTGVTPAGAMARRRYVSVAIKARFRVLYPTRCGVSTADDRAEPSSAERKLKNPIKASDDLVVG